MDMSIVHRTPDPAQEAFDEAVTLFCDILTNDEYKRIWLEEKSCVEDVQAAVVFAQKFYEEKSEHHKVGKWLSKLAPKLLYYSSVLDVLAAANPEYAGLAWGAMKFFIRAMTNHERCLSEIPKALAQIGNVLPRIQLKVSLYNTPVMKRAVAQVYTHIIKFFYRAMTWYSEGKIRHFMSSIYRPYELRFIDLVDDIARYSREVDQLAYAESQAELRQMHIEQRELLSEVRDTKRLIIENQRLSFRGFLDSKRRICEIQFSQILNVLSAVSLLSPQEILRSSKYMRTRRRLQGLPSADSAWRSHKLRKWATCYQSSFLAIKGRSLQRPELKDFAADIISLLQQLNIPVVWSLAPVDRNGSPYFPIDVLKQLVFQVLQINHTLLADQSPALNAARFQSARTEQQWFDILISVLGGLRRIFIVFDTGACEDDFDRGLSWPKAFVDLVWKATKQCPNTAVKVLLLSHGQVTPGTGIDGASLEEATIRLQMTRHPRGAAHRKLGMKMSSGNFRNHGANLLRPFLFSDANREFNVADPIVC